MSRPLLILMTLVALGLILPESATADPDAGVCAPRKRKRRKRKKDPPPEPVLTEDPEIDELSIKDPEDPVVPGKEPEPEPEPWQVGLGAGPAVGFYYAHVIALERAVTSSAPYGGVRLLADLSRDGWRAGLRVSYSATGAPSVSVDGSTVGEAFDGLGLLVVTATFDVDDVWRTLSVGGSLGTLTVFNPLRDSEGVGLRAGVQGRWGLASTRWLGAVADLGVSTMTEAESTRLLGPYRGPVVDFTLALELRVDEVAAW